MTFPKADVIRRGKFYDLLQARRASAYSAGIGGRIAASVDRRPPAIRVTNERA